MPPRRVPDRARPNLPRRPSESGPGRTPEARGLTVAERLRRAVSKDQLDIYKYKPISEDTARLLIVHPRSNVQSDIYVTLKEVPFSLLGTDMPYAYEALSYHWGAGDAERPIYAKDDRTLTANSANPGPVSSDLREFVTLLRNKQIWVKPNLYRALQHLRDNDHDVTLWVDALCINQNDREEKKKQVARMTHVYSHADNVLVWLGDGNTRTMRAMSFIDEVIQLNDLNGLIDNETRVGHWADLLYLMRSSWFSRRWVIQELALAKDASVHCGNDKTHWTSFRDAISLFAQNYDAIKTMLRRSPQYDHDHDALGELDPLGAKVLVDTINNIFRADHSGVEREPIQSLEFLVSKLSTFEASDPRDTVHALRNIARETCRPLLPGSRFTNEPPPGPDYKKDLLTVYEDFVRWVYNTTGKIDIICRHWAVPERKQEVMYYPPLIKSLPSWIKQISDAPFGRQEKIMRGRIHGDSLVGLPGEGSYNASHGIPARVQFGADSHEVDQSVLDSAKSGSCSRAQSSTVTHASDWVAAAVQVEMASTLHARNGQSSTRQADATSAETKNSETQDASRSMGILKRKREDLESSDRRGKRLEMPISAQFANQTDVEGDTHRLGLPESGLAASGLPLVNKTGPEEASAGSQHPTAKASEVDGATLHEIKITDNANGVADSGNESDAVSGASELSDGPLKATANGDTSHVNARHNRPKLPRRIDRIIALSTSVAIAKGALTPGIGGLMSPTESARQEQYKGGRDASIRVDGIQLATLNRVTDPIPDGVIPYNALHMLRGGPVVYDEHNNPTNLVTDKLWRTLVAERGADGRNPPAWYERACYYCLVHDSPNGHINSSELLRKTQPNIVRDFLKRVQAVTWNRRFLEAKSTKGSDRLHGLGPHTALRGDLVCLLFGCSVPVILRHHIDSSIGDYYTLQGEAYMYGCMDGEAILSRTEEQIRKETKSFMIL